MRRILGRTGLGLLLVTALGTAAPGWQTTAAADTAVAAAKARSKKARKKVRTLLRKNGLAKLPSVATALAARSGRQGRGLAAAVVGTPPALVDIPGAPIKELFWQPGVVDAIVAGTPTPEQCGQFFAGNTDGNSGGLGACHMAESVGYSFGFILRGDSSLCYMKRLPTPENVAAGGVSVVAGEVPGGDIRRLFSVPAGAAPRIVKVAVTGDPGGHGERNQDVFLRVAGAAENRAAGNLYQVDIWFCRGGPSGPASGFDRLTIETSGRFQSVSAESEEDWGNHVGSVEGYLTFADGAVAYDTSRARRAQVESASPSFGGFKSDVEIRADDTIATRTYDAGPWGARKVYVFSSFSGTGADTVRFLAGAFKERHSMDGVSFGDGLTGATEFRTSYYAAAPGSDLLGQLDAIDLDGDPFYASPPAPAVDTTGFACDTSPDVAIALDFNNPTVRLAVATCEDRRFEGMHFCHEDPFVQQADQAYFHVCNMH